MRLVFEAGFDRFSGYGNDAVDLAIHLEKAGVDVCLAPMGILPGLPGDFVRLLMKDPRGPKDAMLRFCPPQQMVFPPDHGIPKFAYTMWERTPMALQDFPGLVDSYDLEADEVTIETVTVPRTEFRPLEGWDGLVVTCPMNVEAFEPIIPEGLPTAVVPCGITPDDWPYRRRERDRPLRFLMVGMLAGRKNPSAFVQAWRDVKAAHPEIDATLTFHNMAQGGVHPQWADVYPDVTVSSRPLSREELVDLYYEHDVIVSTSRGEGNNKPAMEFIATGGVAMATDWSGHQNWMHRDYSIALPGSMVQARNAPWAQEFEVDPEALRAEILKVCTGEYDLARMGDIGQAAIRASLSWEAVADRMYRTLTRML